MKFPISSEAVVQHLPVSASGLRRWSVLLCVCALLAGVFPAAAQGSGSPLRIYFMDVEGGQSTLFVSPEHHSLLIDTGWPGNSDRDADRIVAAAHKAGLSRIDTVLLTHYHVDHTGGVPQLVAKIPVGTFIDHGPNRELGDKPTVTSYEGYQKVLATGKYKHIVAHPGEKLPVDGFDLHVISADGALIDKPLPGAGQPNPYCKVSETRAADKTENSRSLGTLMTFGKLRILDLGDLTWDKEMQLMCPANRIGHVDILIVSHHGWYQSSSPALVDAVSPTIAIMDNGATKGGSKPTVETIAKIPGLEALWELHYSEEAGPDNTAAARIANLQGPDSGYGLEVIASPGGAFSVVNERTGNKVAYASHPGSKSSAVSLLH